MKKAKGKLQQAARTGVAFAMSAMLALAPGGVAFGADLQTASVSGGMPGGAPSTQSSSVTWSGATTYTSATSATGETYKSTTSGQNALLVNTSDAVTLANPTVTKTGGTSAGDDESFYGINSAVMCKGGGTTTITGATVTTGAAGANGVFSYGGNPTTNAASGDGTTVVISNSKITTTGDGSGGIMTTGQGITKATNLTVNTSGASSAAIRSDRGGGTVTVNKGTYKTTGVGSPAVYATATINVSNATLTSTASQGVVNEGGNTVVLKNCTLNAGNKNRNGQDKFNNGVFLYQSMSGDASDGASVFKMTGGTLNNTYGHVFHVTNTSAAITLDGVAINNSDSEGVFLSVCDDAWSGLSNAATLNANDQFISGDVLVGSGDTAMLNLTGSSGWKGKTSGSITSHSGSSISTSLGTVNVALGSDSVWQLTGDCAVSSLSGSGKINYNGHTLTVGSTAYTSGSIGSVTETSEAVTETKTALSSCTATLSASKYTYNGKARKPAVTVMNGTTTLTKGTDYTVAYSNNTKAGKATVKITGKGGYTGTITKAFKIIPAKMALASVASKTAGKVVVKWTAAAKKKAVAAGVTGYQVYCKYAGGSYKLARTITKPSTASVTISRTKGKKVYVKIRAYKKVSSSVTYYGAFSAVKSITVKK